MHHPKDNMNVWRRWILPLLVLVVCGAIAASLVKLAFFPDDVSAAAQPGAHISEATVTVGRGDIVNDLTLQGTVARDEPAMVQSGADGTVTAVLVKEGQSVAAGKPLFKIKRADGKGTVVVKAAEAGDVSKIAVVKQQGVSVGMELATLTPARYHVLAAVQPVQLYRLIGAPSEASVTITGGPAPFVCTGLGVQVAEDGSTSVRCAVPRGQTVFSGLQAELGVRIGTVTDALTVPTTAVKGGSGTGTVWIDDGSGQAQERAVTLGLSDGQNVEVVEGVAEGDQIRQYVPGTAAPNEPVCYDNPDGSQYCEDQGWNW